MLGAGTLKNWGGRMKYHTRFISAFCLTFTISIVAVFALDAEQISDPAAGGTTLQVSQGLENQNSHKSLFGNRVAFPTPSQLLPPPRPASPSNGAEPIIITGTTLPATQTLGEKYPYEVMYEAYEGAQIILSVGFQFYDENISEYKTIFTEHYSSSGSGSSGSFQLTSVCMKVTGIWPIRHVFALEDAPGYTTYDRLEADVTCRQRSAPPPTAPNSNSPWNGVFELRIDMGGSSELKNELLGEIELHSACDQREPLGVAAAELCTIDAVPAATLLLPASAQGLERSGFLRGKVSGRTMSGNWYQEPTYTGSDSGTFSFQLSSDGNTITGSWSGGGSTESVSGQRKGTSAPPSEVLPPPSTGGNSLADFDINDNCALDDSEFFNAVDSWLSESISNSLFFDVLDAWIGQSDICAATASLQISTQKTASGSMRFSVEHMNISSSRIEVFDLQGMLIHQQSTSSGQLVWNMRSADGNVVANGVYLYRVDVRDTSGNIVGSELRKLIVIR